MKLKINRTSEASCTFDFSQISPRNKFNNRGLTLIELLVTLAITGIILCIIVSFFITNVRTFDRASSEVDLQSEGQYALEYITLIAAQSRGIKSIENVDGDVRTDTWGAVEETGLIIFDFEYIDESTKNVVNRDEVFIFDKDNNTILNGPKIVGRYIDEIKVEPVTTNKKLSKQRGIILTLKLSQSKGSLSKIIKSQIYFRNYEE